MPQARINISGPEGNWQVLLDSQDIIIGRSPECDVVLNGDGISRRHARFSCDFFGRWIVEDLNSHNGIFVDGQKIKTQAVLPNQNIVIADFTLSIVKQSESKNSGTSISGRIPVIDKGMEEDIVAYREDEAAVLSPRFLQILNEFTGSLLILQNLSQLYPETCKRMATVFNTLVAIIRLPKKPDPIPKSPEIVACHFGSETVDTDIQKGLYLHFSRRVLDAVRSTDAPIRAGSKPSPERDMVLTIVDEHKPHLVFAVRINEMENTVDVLYLDILEEKTPAQMFDFIEAIARQINFAQKNLFLAELQKQERATRDANAKLKEKDRIKDEYVSRVTHDIKGHLAAIQSCLNAAGCGPSDSLSNIQSDMINRALNRTRQLTNFVKELLALTQMRLSGKLRMEEFSPYDCISKALNTVSGKAEDKSIKLVSEIQPALGQIMGDEFSITEMITNLLFNAVKYTPEGGNIHLEAKASENSVHICITDTGIGIPSDDMEHIFEEFFRASNARKTEKDGTGLGLSIVKQIIESHGGQIDVESREGTGSKFTVVLPKYSS